jgi:hypothetical protein
VEAALAELGAAGGGAARGEPLEGRLRREGRVWRVEWRGRSGVVPDSKGMRDLAALLAQPRRPVPAIDLVEASGGPVAAGGDLGPVLDATVRRAYRAHLAELEQAIGEATSDADLGRAERLRAEQAMIAGELAGSLGLGGRPRLAGDPAERARKAVTMRIRTALRAIEGIDPPLATCATPSRPAGCACTSRRIRSPDDVTRELTPPLVGARRSGRRPDPWR